jgi:hypothetical protein
MGEIDRPGRVRLLSESRAGKQHAEDDRQEYLSRFLGVLDHETRRNVKTSGRVPISQFPAP